jgi:WD40 repeat protein
MRLLGVLFIILMLIGGTASAQEAKGWLGADTLDVTKAEADKLGWDAPHGAKLGVIGAGSPADKSGLKTGDIIDLLDGVEVETSSAFEKTIAAKSPTTEVRLRVLSGGRERRITVTLAEHPKVQAVEGQDRPLLTLDSGGHVATIANALVFTRDGKRLVSAAEDKVIRVWDWQAGVTVSTIYGQVQPGYEGMITALAQSQDGRWLAAGGYMTVPGEQGFVIRLYDFTTGKIVALLRGHSDRMNALAFSPEGDRLISGSLDKTAIIWDLQNRRLAQRLKGHTDRVDGVGFTLDGQRAVTSSHDHTLKLWSISDGNEIATLTGHKDKVTTLAVSPADGTIASGGWDGEIRLWDSKRGRYLRTLANQGSIVGSLRFSPDGRLLVSSILKAQADSRPFGAHVWEVATGERTISYAKHSQVVYSTAINPDGRVVATGSSDGLIQVWDLKTGETRRTLMGTGAPIWAVGVSSDGHRIAWGDRARAGHMSEAKSPLLYQLRLPRAGQALGRPERIGEATSRDFVRARTTYGAYALTYRRGGAYGWDVFLDVKRNGQTEASIERHGLEDGFRHTAFSFAGNGDTIISGGSGGALIAYNLRGERLGDYIGHTSDILTVTPSPDGRLLVTGSGDQTIRLWNLTTRELIVTLFHGSDGEWVMWTPQGYYTGSPGADKIVGWQINKGPDQVPEYVGAEQLRQHLNRPDIVEKAIILASAEQAVREMPGTTFKLADLLARPVPRFKIVAPPVETTASGARVFVRIAIEATPDTVKAIRVQVNGRQVEEQTPDIGSGGFAVGERVLDVPLARGRNDVRITLTNAIGEKAESLTLSHEGEGALDKRGTLYLLAIGVDKYPALGKHCGSDGKSSCDLAFSGADARALVGAIKKRLGPAHDRVVKRLLVNGAVAQDEPTAINILNAIDLLKQAKETDTVLLFIAGHALNDGASYRFLPTNAELEGDTLRGATVVPWYALQEAVETAKGRRILLLDTCHSGNAYNERFGNAAYHANIIAYLAARFDQLSLEDPKLGHGLFTYAVVEGLEGKGGIAAKRQISTKELADYVIKRVEALAKQQNDAQEPQYFKGRDAEDYVLARW